MIPRPVAGDFAPYYQSYLDRVVEDDVLEVLETELEPTMSLFRDIDDAGLRFRYAPGKWSVKELLGHLVDGERIFAMRALCFARGETASLPGFDENVYVESGEFDARPIGSLLAEFAAVRLASLALFRSFTPAMLSRAGTANGHRMTAGAVPWVVAGHTRHHLVVLRERYLPELRRRG